MQNAHFQWEHILDVYALPHRDRDLFYATVLENCTANKPPKVLGVAFPVVSMNLSMHYKDGTEVERRFIGRIAEVEFSILAPGDFLGTARSKAVLQLLFVRLDKHCEGYGALLRIPEGLVKIWFNSGIFCSLTELDVEPNTGLLAISRVNELG